MSVVDHITHILATHAPMHDKYMHARTNKIHHKTYEHTRMHAPARSHTRIKAQQPWSVVELILDRYCAVRSPDVTSSSSSSSVTTVRIYNIPPGSLPVN